MGRNLVPRLAIFKHRAGNAYFSTQPGSLVWRIGGKKLPLTTIIRLACPACSHSFQQTAVELVAFGAGKEQFPKSVVVDRSALIEN